MKFPPFFSENSSVSVVMLKVLLALVPGIIACVWAFGYGVLVSLILASAVALLAEAAMLQLRDRPVKPFLLDGSALVTAWLLALALPPLAPWWLVVVVPGAGPVVSVLLQATSIVAARATKLRVRNMSSSSCPFYRAGQQATTVSRTADPALCSYVQPARTSG